MILIFYSKKFLYIKLFCNREFKTVINVIIKLRSKFGRIVISEHFSFVMRNIE